jgi:hypothetical protein
MTVVADAIELHPVAILAGDDPETVVLDLMQPLPAGGRPLGFDGEHGAMNPAGKERGNIPDDKAPSPGMGVRLGEVKNPPLTSGVLSDLIGQAWEKSLCFDAKL